MSIQINKLAFPDPSLTWKITRPPTRPEISGILCHPIPYFRFNKTSLLVPIQHNIISTYFFKIHFNIILQSTPRSSEWSPSLRSPHKNLYEFFFIFYSPNAWTKSIFLDFFFLMKFLLGHAVAQLVEALRYKPEGSGFDSPMVSLEFFIDIILPAALWPWIWLSL